jgi:hypothetical protein
MSMHPKKGEDEHDDDDQTDEINDSVHCGLPWIRSMRVERIDCAFRSALAAQQLWPTSSRERPQPQIAIQPTINGAARLTAHPRRRKHEAMRTNRRA